METPPPAPRPAWSWAAETRSPWPSPTLDSRLDALMSACGRPDGALARVATRVAAAREPTARDPDRVATVLRAEGEPHLHPRVVFAEVRGPQDDAVLTATLSSSRTSTTRCGIATAPAPPGVERIVAIAVEALADLEPLPTRARTGQWLTLSAVTHVPITGARLVVLGPRGLPRTVPTTVERASGVVRARFALDRPGDFLVQLVGNGEAGPQPLLEARVFSDVDPPAAPADPRAPGEVLEMDGYRIDTLADMLAAARAQEDLPALTRHARLDELAQAHAEAMKRARRVAHDLGDGDLAHRFEAEGLVAKSVGENVAHARSPSAAHAALYASPSHRMNMLGPYTHVGVGMAKDDTGVWVCEVFAERLLR